MVGKRFVEEVHHRRDFSSEQHLIVENRTSALFLALALALQRAPATTVFKTQGIYRC